MTLDWLSRDPHALGVIPMTQLASQAHDNSVPAAFHFTVSFGDAPGVVDCEFREVSGIAPDRAFEAVPEGGENRFVHALPKGIKNPLLVLKRGVLPVSASLVGWCRDVLEAGPLAPVKARQVRVSLMDAAGQPLRVWVFEQAFPVKWAVDSFESSKHELAIEQVALAYQSLTHEV